NSWKTPVAENYDESHSVVRILDLSEKNNTVLTSIDSNTTITDLLINLLSTGKITAYADTLDTATIDNSKAIAYISKERNAIKNYMLFEFWELSYSKAKIFVRIVGIAPCVKKDTTFQPIVWFKYHSINNEFDKHKVSVARKKKIRHSKHNKLDVITLNDYFENRLFSGELMKGTNFWQVVLHNN
ncbi:MAG: hypothetical protein ACTHJ0_05840, partial [Flavipsychrobacter sp.]